MTTREATRAAIARAVVLALLGGVWIFGLLALDAIGRNDFGRW